jgi:thioredoxin-like negative regulator of GroEL
VIELLLQAEHALAVGLLDRAEALYQQVMAADPRNSIAVVGLARVALERSDGVGALTFARRALAIDPENNAAQRMVQRLEEVLGNRGVASDPGIGVQPSIAGPPTTDPVAADTEHRSHLARLLRRSKDR